MSKEIIMEAVKNMPLVSKEEGWLMTLDKEEGTLFYSAKQIPDDAVLHQVTDEYGVYLDKNSKLSGVVVEYYEANFLNHHEEMKEIDAKVFAAKDPNANTVTLRPETNDAKIFQALFENTLIKAMSGGMVAV